MLRITVRILGLLLLGLGVALWLAKGGATLFAAVHVQVTKSLSLRPTPRHRVLHVPPPSAPPIAPPLPTRLKIFHTCELAAYRWLMRVPKGERLLQLGVPLIALGALLFIASFFLPKSKSARGGYALQKGTVMLLPQIWDERQISLDIQKHRGNPGVLGTYFDGIITRFVTGQNAQTVEVRTKFLQSFNKYAEVARESYKWKRAIEGGRATLEEDLKDIRAKVELEKARAELDDVGGDHELAELQKEEKRLEVMVKIARRKKELEEIAKPHPPPPLPPPPVPTANEQRANETADLDRSEKQVREEMRIVAVDPTLTDEQRRRKQNALEERLSEIHEQQVRLL